MASKTLGVLEAVGAVGCFGVGLLSLGVASVPTFGLGLLLAHNAHAHLTAK